MARKQQKPRINRPSSKPTTPSELLPQAGQLNNTKWVADRLRHRLDINAIPYNERLSSLLPGYIPTLAALGDIASTSAFVAFDTESVPHCYKTTDVGLAFLPDINRTCPSNKNSPALDKFVKGHRVSTVSFKINGRYHDVQSRLSSALPPKPGRTHRTMEPLRFGKESFVDIEDLDTALADQIEKYRGMVPRKRLVLVGLSLQSDFERLSLEFPQITRYFSGWIDLSTLIKAESRTPTNLDTGLGTALTAFQYPYGDTGFDRRHQASNDAVRTLAVLHGLMDPQNVANIVLRQYQFPGIEISPSIKHFESKVYRALLYADGRNLPSTIDSAQKLAFAFQQFSPIGVAADCSNTRDNKRPYRTSIHTNRRTCGCVCFNSNKALRNFVSATDGQRYSDKHGEVVLKAVRAPLPPQIQAEITKGKRLKIRRKSARRKGAKALDVDWSDIFRNIFLIEEVHEEERTAEKRSWLSWFSRLARTILRKE